MFDSKLYLKLKEKTSILSENDNLDWKNKIFYRLTPLFLTNPSRFLEIHCPFAGRTFYVVNPSGDVFPCSGNRKHIIGNVKTDSFYNIVSSDRAKAIREKLYSQDRGCVCWMRCMFSDTIGYQFPGIICEKNVAQKWEELIEHLEEGAT